MGWGGGGGRGGRGRGGLGWVVVGYIIILLWSLTGKISHFSNKHAEMGYLLGSNHHSRFSEMKTAEVFLT
jgi:hypothetical protein